MPLTSILKSFLPPIILSAYRGIRRDAEIMELQTLRDLASSALAYIPTHTLQKLLFYRDEMIRLQSIPGDILEFGVHKGVTLAFICHISEILDHPMSNRKIVGFDTFEGFPEGTLKSWNDLENRDAFKDTSLEAVERLFLCRDKNRVKLIKGDIYDTLPEYLKNNPNRISMAICDVDVGPTTEFILRQILGRISSGGRIYFDEYSLNGWSETLGVDALGLKVTRNGPYQPTAWINR